MGIFEKLDRIYESANLWPKGLERIADDYNAELEWRGENKAFVIVNDRKLVWTVYDEIKKLNPVKAEVKSNGISVEFDEESIWESLEEDLESSVDFLIKDEEEAIAGYEKAQKDIQDDKKYDADALGDIWDELEHIRAEEEEHIEELNQIKKDYIGEDLNETLLAKKHQDAEILPHSEKIKAFIISKDELDDWEY